MRAPPDTEDAELRPSRRGYGPSIAAAPTQPDSILRPAPLASQARAVTRFNAL